MVKINKIIATLLISIFIIMYFVPKTFGEDTKLDCKVYISYSTIGGDIFKIISNKNSSNTSISIKDAVKFFEERNLNVKEVRNYNKTLVDINSTSLIGTNYKIITDNIEYTVVVYGDTTGDGLVNAADINIITNVFLGKNRLDDWSRREAGDLFKDDKLDAADIAIMKKSFLGTLENDILDNRGKQSEYDIIKYSYSDENSSYDAKIENMVLNMEVHIDGNEYGNPIDSNNSIPVTEEEIDTIRKLKIILANDKDNSRICNSLYLISNGDETLYNQDGDTSDLYNLHDQEDYNNDGIITYRESGDYWLNEIFKSNIVQHEKIYIPYPENYTSPEICEITIENMKLNAIVYHSGEDYSNLEKYEILLNRELLQKIQYVYATDCDMDLLRKALYSIALDERIMLNSDDIHYESLYNEKEDLNKDEKIMYKEYGCFLLDELESEFKNKNNQYEKISFEYSFGIDPQRTYEVKIDDKIMCVTRHVGSGFVRAHNSIEMNTVKLTDTEYEYIREIQNSYSYNEETDVFGLCVSAYYISKNNSIFTEPSNDDYEEMYDEKYDYNSDGIVTDREFGDYFLSGVYSSIN